MKIEHNYQANKVGEKGHSLVLRRRPAEDLYSASERASWIVATSADFDFWPRLIGGANAYERSPMDDYILESSQVSINTSDESDPFKRLFVIANAAVQERLHPHRPISRIALAGDLDAMFLLTAIQQSGEVSVATLDHNLNAPDGWLAFAKLWRAGLITLIAGYASVTTEGRHLIQLYLDKQSKQLTESNVSSFQE